MRGATGLKWVSERFGVFEGVSERVSDNLVGTACAFWERRANVCGDMLGERLRGNRIIGAKGLVTEGVSARFGVFEGVSERPSGDL